MRYLLPIVIGTLITATLLSCNGKQETTLVEEARRLYEKSITLGTQYTDSILCAKDSATVNRLVSTYEEQLTKLNFAFPPDTDYAMDEGQNDTLINMNEKFIQARDSMLYYFAHRPLVTDSIGSDSISPSPIPTPALGK